MRLCVFVFFAALVNLYGILWLSVAFLWSLVAFCGSLCFCSFLCRLILVLTTRKLKMKSRKSLHNDKLAHAQLLAVMKRLKPLPLAPFMKMIIFKNTEQTVNMSISGHIYNRHTQLSVYAKSYVNVTPVMYLVLLMNN